MAITQVNGRPAPKRIQLASSHRRDTQAPDAEDRLSVDGNPRPIQRIRIEERRLRTCPDSDPGSPGATKPPQGERVQISWRLLPSTPVGRALVSASQRLEEAGCEAARLDAQVLLAHVLGVTRSWLFAHHDARLDAEQADAFTRLVARRARHEPVAYLMGRKEFYGLEFVVDRRVLIPRPETELLVDLALAQIEARGRRRVVVADVGTGSGAIGLTLVSNAPWIRLYGLDISADALDVAQINRERLSPTADVHLLQSNLLEKLPERADLIVANLPYIDSGAYRELAPGVRDFEPRLALESGIDGLDAIRSLLNQLDGKLNSGGAVLLEIGPEQGDILEEIAKQIRPRPNYVGLRRDYSGMIRLVTLEY